MHTDKQNNIIHLKKTTTLKKNWYCASFETIKTNGKEIFPDPEYFAAESDEAAVDYAMELADDGVDYVDEGHFDLELISVCKVDPENDWIETETVWF